MRGQAHAAGPAHLPHQRRRASRSSRRASCRRRPRRARGTRRRPARCRIGVPRLDEMLGGGLPRGYSLLVAGPSGSGKSILAAAFLAEGARSGETGRHRRLRAAPEPIAQPRARRADRRAAASAWSTRRALDLSIDEIAARC